MKISIAMATYNGENYVLAQLQSFVNQTRQPDEVVITDDCSTDMTSKICQKYAELHPNLIKYYRREEYLGMIGNWLATIKAARGKYIALCEGDDYWSDPLKLQKQVDFLEKNEEYVMCFHRCRFLSVVDGKKD